MAAPESILQLTLRFKPEYHVLRFSKSLRKLMMSVALFSCTSRCSMTLVVDVRNSPSGVFHFQRRSGDIRRQAVPCRRVSKHGYETLHAARVVFFVAKLSKEECQGTALRPYTPLRRCPSLSSSPRASVKARL